MCVLSVRNRNIENFESPLSRSQSIVQNEFDRSSLIKLEMRRKKKKKNQEKEGKIM